MHLTPAQDFLGHWNVPRRSSSHNLNFSLLTMRTPSTAYSLLHKLYVCFTRGMWFCGYFLIDSCCAGASLLGLILKLHLYFTPKVCVCKFAGALFLILYYYEKLHCLRLFGELGSWIVNNILSYSFFPKMCADHPYACFHFLELTVECWSWQYI